MSRIKTDTSSFDFGYEDKKAFSFAMLSSNSGISKSWILLNGQSSVSTFYNRILVPNIRPCSGEPLKLQTNVGIFEYKEVAHLKNFRSCVSMRIFLQTPSHGEQF